jgi:hypothetical protein
MKRKKVARSWQSELESNPKLIELNRRVAARKRALKNDKEFAIETAKLHIRLERALPRFPKYIRNFLHRFSNPVGPRLPELNHFLNSVRNRQLRKLFQEYVKYVARFGVALRVRKGDRRMVSEVLVPWGRNLHVRVVNGHFEPGKGYPGGRTPFEYFFESENLPIPSVLRKKLESSDAKVVLIDDSNWSSLLTKMEYFAYDPERLTFILHNAEQPYLLSQELGEG